MTKMTDNLLQKGTDFLRYLETEHIELKGLAKHDAEIIYDTHYTSYRSQISPDEKIPVFSIVCEKLNKANRLHLRNNVFYPGPMTNNHSQRSKDSKQVSQTAFVAEKLEPNSASSTEHDLSINVKRRRKRHRHKKNSKTQNSSSLHVDMTESTDGSGTQYSKKGPRDNANMTTKEVSRRLSSTSEVDRKVTKPRTHRKKLAVDQHISYNKPDISQKEENGKLEDHIKKRTFYCNVCSTNCTSRGDYISHTRGRLHRTSVIMQELKKRR